jgi:hypothetical protein
MDKVSKRFEIYENYSCEIFPIHKKITKQISKIKESRLLQSDAKQAKIK